MAAEPDWVSQSVQVLRVALKSWEMVGDGTRCVELRHSARVIGKDPHINNNVHRQLTVRRSVGRMTKEFLRLRSTIDVVHM